MSIVFLDNRYLPAADAKLPITDRGVLYGDGVYTTLLVREGEVYFLEDHLERLEKQCAHLKIIPPTIEKEMIFQLLENNQALESMWRLKIFITGGNTEGVNLKTRHAGHLFMTMDPFVPPPFKALNCTLYPIPVMTPHASFKSLSCLHRFYVADYADQKKQDDAITLTESGLLLEASFGNLTWVVSDTLYTPDPELPLYFGVTIEKVTNVAHDLGFKVEYVKKRLVDIPENAHLFRVNSLRGIRPIGSIDGRKFTRNEQLESILLSHYADIQRAQITLPH